MIDTATTTFIRRRRGVLALRSGRAGGGGADSPSSRIRSRIWASLSVTEHLLQSSPGAGEVPAYRSFADPEKLGDGRWREIGPVRQEDHRPLAHAQPRD